MRLRETPASPKVRLDIQGLRTLAVGLVIIYHLYPENLPGGFVGVDIFLVISGFLIIGSLVRGVATTGKIRLGTFYARRIRRLLPASTVVLLAVMAAAVLVLPQSRWQDVARDVVASALQVQKWNQAFGSVSYESAGALVSPVQHFWSLAVEEQFYLVIPLVMILAVGCGRFMKVEAKSSSLWFLVILATVSFVHSVVFSPQNRDLAYFATTTRMWELSLGGIAALVLPLIRTNSLLRFAAGWVGLGMVIYSAFFFQTSMAFPGYIALLPVIGTVLIIVSGSLGRSASALDGFGLPRYLSLRSVTYLGDISYSLYLWHWPVIVFYVLIRGHEPGLIGGVGILALSFTLAALSYHYIEQRFRVGKLVHQAGARRYRPQTRNRSAYGLAGVLLVLSVVSAAGPWSIVQIKSDQLVSQKASPDYPGALAFDVLNPIKVPADLPVLPDPAVAGKDVPLVYQDECGVYDPATTPDSRCYYGSPTGSKTMVLVGDSHAGQYLDPLAALAEKDGWRLRAMVRNGCPFSSAPPSSSSTTYTNCSDQNAETLKKILAMKPERVIVAGMTPNGYRKSLGWGWGSTDVLVDGYVQMLRPLSAAGIKVSVIADTPYPEFSVPDCVLKHGPGASECQIRKIPVDDPLRISAERIGNIQVIDFQTYMCREESCPPVVGNVLVFRDNHLTTTFAKSLELPLEEALNLS